MESHDNVTLKRLIGLIAYSKFLRDLGRSTVCGWRWRQSGLLDEPKNINGRLYLTGEQIERFYQRVESGQFAKRHKTPPPPATVAA